MNEFEEKVVEPAHNGKGSRKFDLIALLLCLVIALSVWLYVESINQDIVEKEIIITFNAEKQIFDETGMYIFSGNEDIDYSQVEVKLTVSGSKAVLEKYDDDEYVVELDTSGITQAGGRYGVYFKYRLPSEEIQYKSIVATAYTSSLMLVDHKAEREVPLTAYYVDTPSKKESIIECIPKTEKIFISGPASMVNEISSVMATVNVNTLTESTVVKSKSFEFFGEDGSPILLNGSYVTLTPSEVEIDVIINYVNEPLTVRVEPKTQSTDGVTYEASISFENGEAVVLYFDGESSCFPRNGELVWNIGDLSIWTDGDPKTVSDILNSTAFDEYRNKLSLHNADDSNKTVQIIVKKGLNQIDNTNQGKDTSAGSENDDTPSDS